MLAIRAAVGAKVAIGFGAPGRPLFGFYHPPKDGLWRGTGVVLCNPFGTDQTRSERTYRHLAERLAAAGFACLRFDLFGTGDSGGDEHEPELVRGWVDDVGVAARELRARSGAAAIALVGLRLGGTVALLHAAASGDVDSLVLWSPCVSGTGFVGEVTKLHKIYARMEPHLAAAKPPTEDGEEALGTFLPRALVDELSRIDLLQTTRRPAGRTLVIDGGNFPGKDALLGRLGELGAAPELRSHPGHKFLITVSHRAIVPDDVLASIVEWLGQTHPKDCPATAPSHEARAGQDGPAGERPVLFGESHPLFGILTPAAAGRGPRPTIVLSNAGCVNRVGPHRTYVRWARRWAHLGFDVLRIDLSGIGDSPVAPGTQENVPYPPSALDDLAEAIRAVAPGSGTAAANPSGKVIIAGLCSGGDYAFQLGAAAPSIVGALLLNPRTFCVLDLAAVESADGGVPPRTPVEEVPRTLRAMAERVETLLVVSRNDPGVAYVDAHAGDAMGALEGAAGFRRVNIEGADHTFTPISTQTLVGNVLAEHLAARYGG
jgi:alpha-beta hydrolase superfamily lysophospholipase